MSTCITCPRCDHDHFNVLSVVDARDIVRVDVSCTKCSFAGTVEADADEWQDSDDVVGEWV